MINNQHNPTFNCPGFAPALVGPCWPSGYLQIVCPSFHHVGSEERNWLPLQYQQCSAHSLSCKGLTRSQGGSRISAHFGLTPQGNMVSGPNRGCVFRSSSFNCRTLCASWPLQMLKKFFRPFFESANCAIGKDIKGANKNSNTLSTLRGSYVVSVEAGLCWGWIRVRSLGPGMPRLSHSKFLHESSFLTCPCASWLRSLAQNNCRVSIVSKGVVLAHCARAMSISCGRRGTSRIFRGLNCRPVTGAGHRPLSHLRGRCGTFLALLKRSQAWIKMVILSVRRSTGWTWTTLSKGRKSRLSNCRRFMSILIFLAHQEPTNLGYFSTNLFCLQFW